MRFELIFHSYVEVFNRMFSVRLDVTDWEFRVQKSSASVILYIGPLNLGYTNQNILNERIQEMIASINHDFAEYQETWNNI